MNQAEFAKLHQNAGRNRVFHSSKTSMANSLRVFLMIERIDHDGGSCRIDLRPTKTINDEGFTSVYSVGCP
jgi:hypothetical protein